MVEGLLDLQKDKLKKLETLYMLNRDKMVPLVAILDLTKGPEFQKMRQDLIDTICKEFAPDVRMNDQLDMKIPCSFQSYNTPGLVCFSSTSVSPLGFLLLQHLGVEDMAVEKINVGLLAEPLLSALSSRVSSQQKPVKFANTGVHVIRVESEEKFHESGDIAVHVICNTAQSALDFCLIVEKCQAVTSFVILTLRVGEDIGTDGWAGLAKAAAFFKQKGPSYAFDVDISTTRKAMVQGRRGDVRSIWDSMEGGCKWEVDSSKHDGFRSFQKVEEKFMGERDIVGWVLLERVLDMSEEEWIRQECECTECYLDAIANNEYDDTDDDTNDDTTEDDA